jgi:hypothetical protein
MLESVVVLTVELDNSSPIAREATLKVKTVQDWINNLKYEVDMEKYDDFTLKAKKLHDIVKNIKLPSSEYVNNMSLQESIVYETMLLEIVDIIPSNVNLAVEILFHLKIITTNQIHKFRIFE